MCTLSALLKLSLSRTNRLVAGLNSGHWRQMEIYMKCFCIEKGSMEGGGALQLAGAVIARLGESLPRGAGLDGTSVGRGIPGRYQRFYDYFFTSVKLLRYLRSADIDAETTRPNYPSFPAELKVRRVCDQFYAMVRTW